MYNNRHTFSIHYTHFYPITITETFIHVSISIKQFYIVYILHFEAVIYMVK